MSKPVRIQLSRRKGWKMPPNTVVVSRPSKWGNPFVVSRDQGRWFVIDMTEKCYQDWQFPTELAARQNAVRRYRRWLFTQERSRNLVPLLRGKNLACWCKPGDSCHADVLLELANKEGGQA